MASTTFLALTNKLLRRLNEVEISQSDFPSSRGVQAFAKDAINASVEQINTQHFEWPFNTSSGTQLLVIGQSQYTFPTNLKTVDWNSFHIVKNTALSVNHKHINFISKDEWEQFLKDKDQDASTSGVNVPLYVFKGQNFGFGLTPSPNQAYTVEFDYWLNHTSLDLYSDTPTIPSTYDDVIIQGGLYHYYMFRDNQAAANSADEKFKMRIRGMVNVLGNQDNTLRSTMIVHRSWSSGGAMTYSGGSGD